MPKVDGYTVLTRVKASEHLRCIPVIMLTTTDDPREIHRCYELGVSSYVVKPVDFSRFEERIRELGLFIQIVSFPGAQEGQDP
jgi:response regulator RpfG family c-di-GMP phosphodiesterase